MNWFDNVSSDSDQPIAPACLYQGHWRHRLHAYGDKVLCRVVIDVAEPRVVAAQVIENGLVEDLDAGTLVPSVFVVDETAGSRGLSVGEVADLLIRDYHVGEALNLDGGGSTSMAMALFHRSTLCKLSTSCSETVRTFNWSIRPIA